MNYAEFILHTRTRWHIDLCKSTAVTRVEPFPHMIKDWRAANDRPAFINPNGELIRDWQVSAKRYPLMKHRNRLDRFDVMFNQ